jgi:hypothetical protein
MRAHGRYFHNPLALDYQTTVVSEPSTALLTIGAIFSLSFLMRSRNHN